MSATITLIFILVIVGLLKVKMCFIYGNIFSIYSTLFMKLWAKSGNKWDINNFRGDQSHSTWKSK